MIGTVATGFSKGFEGKVGLVTGGGSGLGRATAQSLARKGARVVVCDAAIEGGRETVAHIEAEGGAATFVACDVSQAPQVEALVATVLRTYGRLDYAVNNAGLEGPVAPLNQYPLEAFEQVVAVNLIGVFLCLQHEIPAIAAQGGAIVNVASMAGLVGAPGAAAYTASKHGVIGLTKVAALELATLGVRVNAVCPSFIDTPMVRRTLERNPDLGKLMTRVSPMNRLGTPDEVAQAVVWLCSDEASFVNGAALPIDGGAVAR